ncbi:MAG: hypothetical protein ACRDTG_09740 [Pseudonocardiaceae bacterium]
MTMPMTARYFLVLTSAGVLHAVPVAGARAPLCGARYRAGRVVALAARLHMAPASCAGCLHAQQQELDAG